MDFTFRGPGKEGFVEANCRRTEELITFDAVSH